MTGRAMKTENYIASGNDFVLQRLWLLLSGVGSCGAFWATGFIWREPLSEQLRLSSASLDGELRRTGDHHRSGANFIGHGHNQLRE